MGKILNDEIRMTNEKIRGNGKIFHRFHRLGRMAKGAQPIRAWLRRPALRLIAYPALSLPN